MPYASAERDPRGAVPEAVAVTLIVPLLSMDPDPSPGLMPEAEAESPAPNPSAVADTLTVPLFVIVPSTALATMPNALAERDPLMAGPGPSTTSARSA